MMICYMFVYSFDISESRFYVDELFGFNQDSDQV